MMSMKKKVLTLAAMVAALAASSVMAADVSYTSVLSGKVDSVVPVGTTVAEGDVLLTVESLAGPILCRQPGRIAVALSNRSRFSRGRQSHRALS